MNVVNECIKDSIDLWNDCLDADFIIQMQNGSLKKEIFLKYLIQDSLYLRDYIKTFAYAFIKCKNWKQMQFFASSINYVNDGENLTRLNYLREFNLDDNDIDKMKKTKECEDYTNFLLNIGRNESVPCILMSVLPCMLGYQYVFERISKKSPHLLSGYYSNLVKDYISNEYKKTSNEWVNFTNSICESISENDIPKLKSIFYKASKHELLFWKMLGE